MSSVPPSGTNGIPIGQEYWKQEAEKLDALEKGQPEWNVPVGKEEGVKVVKELKCNTKKLEPIKNKIKELKSELKPLKHDGANVISSQVTVFKKDKDGNIYEVVQPAGESCKRLKAEEKFIAAKKYDLEKALDKIKASLPKDECEKFDKDPVKYLREHRSTLEAFRKTDTTAEGVTENLDNLIE